MDGMQIVGTFVDAEIQSQPDAWRAAAEIAQAHAEALPAPGERVAFVGCGTSWFIAMSAARRREACGLGESDAFAASEFPHRRAYDRVIAISRSGTTTEVVDLLADLRPPSTLVTAVDESPAADFADHALRLTFADERSVVQTRFATSVLALLRVHFGEHLETIVRDGATALEIDIESLVGADQCTFLGSGWRIGLAHEAALKAREAAQLWTEAYPAMDYRHGPIAVAQPGRLVWSLGETPPGLRHQVEATGASFIEHNLDPMARLVVAQRYAVAVAKAKGLDPDSPRGLTRSVILT